MKVGGGALLQGSDYESNEIAGDAFSGAVMMAGNLLGPAVMSRALRLGATLAGETVDDVLWASLRAMRIGAPRMAVTPRARRRQSG